MLINLLNKYISKLKGDQYTIDARIGTSYLLGIIVRRGFMKLRGFACFPFRANTPYVGSGTVLLRKKQIKFGRGVTFGVNSYLDAMSENGIILGNNSSLGRNTRIECTGSLRTIGKGLVTGDNVGLGSDAYYGCAGGIIIGSDTIIGNSVSLHSENHRTDDPNTAIRLQGVTHKGIKIGENCWIGAKATILDGAIIEDSCIIAAGAVVMSGIYEKNCVYGGVPAKLLKRRFDLT